MERFLPARIREGFALLSPETRVAWLWDLLTGLFAGIYQGCIWTFVMRVARKELLATNAQMGWMSAAPALGYLFATVWARQMDGKEKMPFVFWTWLCSRGLFLFTPFLATRSLFIFLVCIIPIIFSISTPAYVAIMKDIYPDALRGRLMSYVRMGVYIMTLVTSLCVGRLLDNGLSWQAVFSVGGFFGVLTAFAFKQIPLPPTPIQTTPAVSTREFFHDTLQILRRNMGFRLFLFSVFVSGFGNIISATLIPLQQVDYFHVSNTDVANLQNISSVATIIGFGFWGSFMDKRGSLAAVLLAISFNLIVPFIYVFTHDMQWLYVASAAMGLAISGIELAYVNTILMFAEEGKASQYQALHSSFFGIRGTIAPQCAIPLLSIVGMRASFAIALVILFFGAILQAVAMRDYRAEEASD
ncbi:MAG: MFS transporter [Armatimonadetes bacterium]|nr:MFS transporter [Armatimonadota bacterium]